MPNNFLYPRRTINEYDLTIDSLKFKIHTRSSVVLERIKVCDFNIYHFLSIIFRIKYVYYINELIYHGYVLRYSNYLYIILYIPIYNIIMTAE